MQESDVPIRFESDCRGENDNLLNNPQTKEGEKLVSRFSPTDSYNSLEALEQKVSPSSVGVVAAPVVSTIQAPVSDDDDPLPDAEPAPIPDPGSGPPVGDPLLPPSGPPGPGS